MNVGKVHCLRFQIKSVLLLRKQVQQSKIFVQQLKDVIHLAEIILFPAIVQGPQAAPSIVKCN